MEDLALRPSLTQYHQFELVKIYMNLTYLELSKVGKTIAESFSRLKRKLKNLAKEK